MKDTTKNSNHRTCNLILLFSEMSSFQTFFFFLFFPFSSLSCFIVFFFNRWINNKSHNLSKKKSEIIYPPVQKMRK